jgi:hypothetical protein
MAIEASVAESARPAAGVRRVDLVYPGAGREFFDHEEDIPKLMQAIGAGEPQISFYRPLDTNDEI